MGTLMHHLGMTMETLWAGYYSFHPQTYKKSMCPSSYACG